MIQALGKHGWAITHNLLQLTLGEHFVLADVGAERAVGSQKGTERIAVVIKAFTALSLIAD